MTLRGACLLCLILFVAGCGDPGAPQYGGEPPADTAAFGSCAFCHADKAAAMLTSAPDLKCEVCHQDLMPGNVGPGHRSIPGPEQVPSFPGPAHDTGEQVVFGSCALCHNNLAMTLTPLSATLNCTT